MANNWKIPAWLEKEVRERDASCVYCGCKFMSPKESAKFSASWEHIINDENIITRENIALCCRGCNASKGQKPVSVWLSTNYCQERGITPESVAPIISWPYPMGSRSTHNKSIKATDSPHVARFAAPERRH